MANAGDALGALEELERSYDGPIPHEARLVARLGSPEWLRLIEAEGQIRFFRDMIGRQIEAIRRARMFGDVPCSLPNDLALYRRQRVAWRREAKRLASLVQGRAASPT